MLCNSSWERGLRKGLVVPPLGGTCLVLEQKFPLQPIGYPGGDFHTVAQKETYTVAGGSGRKETATHGETPKEQTLGWN